MDAQLTGHYNLFLYDGVCVSTRPIQKLTGYLQNSMKGLFSASSSGRHMFIDFVIGRNQGQKGFSANIHYGIEFKNAYNLHKSNI